MKKSAALPAKQFLDTVEAHETATAGKTPQRAREALLAQPIEVAGYTVHPASLNSQILLEEIDHPILRAAQAPDAETAAATPFTGRDVLNLIYIFTHPEEAWRTMGMSKENFLAAAARFGFQVAPAAVGELVPAIRDMIFKSGRTTPGTNEEGGDEEAGDRDPLPPSQRPQPA